MEKRFAREDLAGSQLVPAGELKVGDRMLVMVKDEPDVENLRLEEVTAVQLQSRRNSVSVCYRFPKGQGAVSLPVDRQVPIVDRTLGDATCGR